MQLAVTIALVLLANAIFAPWVIAGAIRASRFRRSLCAGMRENDALALAARIGGRWTYRTPGALEVRFMGPIGPLTLSQAVFTLRCERGMVTAWDEGARVTGP